MEVKQAQTYLYLLRVALILTLCFTLLSVGCRITSVCLTDSAYHTYLDISTASPQSERTAAYTNAIQLSPGNPEAYLLLIDTYGENGIFDKHESESFLSLYNTYHSSFKTSDPNYAVLLSNIGFLYANGYADNTTTRLRMALPFLKLANEYLPEDADEKNAVACYCQIGAFYEDYIWDVSSVREVSDTVMLQLIAEIEQTLANFQTDTSPDAIFNSLGFNVAVCNLLYNQRDILAATVPREQVTGILDTIYSSLPDSESLQKEQTRQLLKTLEDNQQTYYDMVERAYARKEESP